MKIPKCLTDILFIRQKMMTNLRSSKPAHVIAYVILPKRWTDGQHLTEAAGDLLSSIAEPLEGTNGYGVSMGSVTMFVVSFPMYSDALKYIKEVEKKFSSTGETFITAGISTDATHVRKALRTVSTALSKLHEGSAYFSNGPTVPIPKKPGSSSSPDAPDVKLINC